MAHEESTKFQARFTAVDARRRQMLFSQGGMSLSDDHLLVLEDYLHTSSRRRVNPLPLMRVQLHMLQELMAVEHVLSELKKDSKRLRANESEAAIDAKPRFESSIKGVERDIYVHEAFRRCLRDIGDGIAWRLFDYDRAVLTEIAHRPSGKSINIGGIEPELIEFAGVFNSSEGIAVLNDLTHFLKLGDLIVKKDDGTFEIVEVKKGDSRSRRITRQKQAMRRTVEFLNFGERERGKDGFIISDLEVVPETAHASVRASLARAATAGTAVEKIGDFLIVVCADMHRISEIGLEKCKAISDKGYEAVEKLQQNGDLILPFASNERYIEVRNSAPLSIFPFPELTRIKLITGAVFLQAFVNISAVLRYFEQKGWAVYAGPEECLKDFQDAGPRTEPIIAKLRKRSRHVELSYHWIARIGYEFLKPRTIMDVFEALLKESSGGGAWNFVNLIGEPKIWD